MEDEPVLQRNLLWIWKSFTELSYRRGVSMSGAVPITYHDMEAYCSLKGIYSLYERQRLLHFIDVLDRRWMAKHYEKQTKAEEPTPPKNRSRQPSTSKRPPRTRVS